MAYASKDYDALIAAEVEAYLNANPPASGIQLGETQTTAYRGDRGKTAYDHSQDSTIHLSSTQKTDLTDGGETTLHTHPATTAVTPTSWGKYF
jgi:hypothetical protein